MDYIDAVKAVEIKDKLVELLGTSDNINIAISVFARNCFWWLKNRRIMEYRGDADVQ